MSRTLIVGDIHGCYDELLSLLDRVGLNPEDRLISVGDLVDRGPNPLAVVKLFRTRPNAVALCGNHEWQHIRGAITVSQKICRLQMGAEYEDFCAWAARLPRHLETPELRAMHWGCYPGLPLGAAPEEVRVGAPASDTLLRARYGEQPWYLHYTEDVPIVFGHRVVGRQPRVFQDRAYALDTGAVHGLALSGLLLPERRLVSVPARADYWSQVRSGWAPRLDPRELASALQAEAG